MRVSIAARLVREIGGFLYTRPAKVNWPGGVVSFTFDDFPRSGWVNGGAILEDYDRRGTYYAALGMMGTENHLGPMFTLDEAFSLSGSSSSRKTGGSTTLVHLMRRSSVR